MRSVSPCLGTLQGNPQIMNHIKKLLQQLLLIGLVFVVWWKTLNQTLWGDGFYYFDFWYIGTNTNAYNFGSIMIHKIIAPIFRDNMNYYFLLQIILLACLTILIYYLALKLTSDKLIAFSTGVIFSSNYGSVFEMMAEGQLNRFLDRVPNFLFSILAAYFLVKFIKDKKIFNLVFSYTLFATGIFFGHYATFFLSFFVFYPTIFLFNSKDKIKSIFLGVLLAISFVALNFVITRNSDQKSDYFSVLFDPSQKIIEKTFYQMTPLVISIDTPKLLAKYWLGKPLDYPQIPIVRVLTFFIVTLTVIGGYLIYKQDKNLFKLYLVCILCIYSTTAIMLTTDPFRFDPFKRFEGGRLLFIQSISYSIALSIFLKVVFQYWKKTTLLCMLFYLTLFITYNSGLIDKEINVGQYRYNGIKRYFSYIKDLWPQFNSESVVILISPHLIASSNFVNRFYGPPYVKFVTNPVEIQPILKLNKNNIFVLDYDYERTTDGYYFPDKGRVVDLTDSYRQGKLNLHE